MGSILKNMFRAFFPGFFSLILEEGSGVSFEWVKRGNGESKV